MPGNDLKMPINPTPATSPSGSPGVAVSAHALFTIPTAPVPVTRSAGALPAAQGNTRQAAPDGPDPGFLTEPDEGDDESLIAQLPPDVRRAILRDRKLEETTGFGRSGAAISYLLGMRWKAPPRPSVDLGEARRLLDASHAGLEDVKESVLDWLATQEWIRRQGLPSGTAGSISLCLVGPPGTGKTSIAAAIAGAAKRELERIPMGGADDIYLVGADRAYTGARPGSILRRLHASRRHPSEIVVLLDEIDKLSRNAARDPLPVLLALLDPSQNREFQDQFLDSVRIDLSGTLFLATANDEAAIPGPLKDRMRMLRLPGYTREEQAAIGSEYILPRMLERRAISDQVHVAAEVVESLVYDFPASEGLRQLEHRLDTVVSRGLRCHMETDRSIWVDADLARSWVRSGDTKQPIGFRATPAGAVGSRHILGLGGQPAQGAGVAAGAPGVATRSGPRLASTPASKPADAG